MFSHIKNTLRFERIRKWYYRYERYLIPAALLAGIITDFVMFQAIELSFAFSILTFHIVLSAVVIAFIHIYDLRPFARLYRFFKYLRLFAPLVLQYSFGALLSGFFVFYWFSGVFSASWPFILLIIFLMVSNDVLKRYYLRLTVQLSVYFFVLFSWSVLIIPYLLHSLGVWIFLLSGVFSLVLFYFYLRWLAPRVPRLFEDGTMIVVIVISIYASMNILYFTNIIPPIPLSVRDAGVYHHVERVDGMYEVHAEETGILDVIIPGQRIHIEPGQRVYVFASVFAPTDFELDVQHHWQHKDPESGEWESRSTIPYTLVGGRDGGFRGYTYGTIVTPGKWRVDVETERGQVIGRVSFTAVETEEEVELIEAEK